MWGSGMNLRSDQRYTITREWTGRERPQWVVRFCDEWISAFDYKSSAMIRATCLSAQRRGALTVEALEQ